MVVGRGVADAEFAQELGGFEPVPGCAVGGVAFHDGDDALDDAPAVVGLFDDVLFERLGEVEVGLLLLGWVVHLCNHMFGL